MHSNIFWQKIMNAPIQDDGINFFFQKQFKKVYEKSLYESGISSPLMTLTNPKDHNKQ